MLNLHKHRVKIPHGMAKQIVGAMADGETKIVRPEHSVAFYNAARRMGVLVKLSPFSRDGEPRFQMKRVGVRTPADQAKTIATGDARLPYGTATRVVRALRPGETIYVPHKFIISFRKAARESGVPVFTNSIRRHGETVWKMRRKWIRSQKGKQFTGHRFQRQARRDQAGRFIPDGIAA